MSDPFYGHVGASVRARREAIAMTQASLAAQVGLSRTTITNIEAGRQAVLLHQAVAIASTLQVQVNALLPSVVEGLLGSEIEHEESFKELLSRLSTTKESRRETSR